MSIDNDASKGADTTSDVGAPNVTRLKNQHGPIDRRKLLTAATTGVMGTILGGRSANAAGFLSSLMGNSNALVPSASAAESNALRLATLGDYVWLTPTKLGGGAQVQDLASGKTMAWIEYWNYGDSCPIAHHLAAFPSADPRKGFEFLNSTQGGQNVLIYGIPTQIREHGMLDPLWGQGNQIYRVGFDGQQMNLLENIAETTGIGLGVHTVIFPDATGFSVSDGQKDIVAFFKRATGYDRTEVIDAFRFDWIGNEPNGLLADNWFKGGKVRITRLVKASETGLYDYRGTKGNKLEWEMVPMGEYLAYTGQLPGSDVKALTGADNCVHHPIHPLSLVTLRMFSVGVVIDRTTMEPIAAVSSPDGTSKDALPIKKIADGIWELTLDNVVTSGHECGFSPDGKWFTMTNNTRQNSMGVFNCEDRDPRNWKRVTVFKDSHWTGATPSPFHITFSMDASKMFVSELHQKPAKSAIVVVDTKTWTTIKRFENVGVDTQTMHVTYDGKYVLAIFSGFQRLEGGTFIFTQDTLEPVGYIPNFGGHHDCVIVPRNNQELIHSRSTTV